jgi:hypothetical protein
MRERISPYQFSEEDRIAKLAEIENEALSTVDQTYGSGYPLWKPGSHELAFHNGHHARTVGEGALKLCSHFDLPSLEQAIAKTAGNAHDIVQRKGRGIDEAESATWIENRLQNSNLFPPHMQKMATLAIIGTEPFFENGLIVSQKASQLVYPDKASEIVAKSVASADLGELYSPEGPYLSHQLFREIHGMKPGNQIEHEKLIQWQSGNVQMAEQYTYPLEQANAVLATHRDEVIDFHRELLDGLQSGTIEGWQDLLQRDKAFIRQHRQ